MYSMWMHSIGKEKDADLGIGQDGSKYNKRDEAELYRGPRWGGGLLNSPKNFNERDRAMGLSPGVPIKPHLVKKVNFWKFKLFWKS